MLLDRMLKRLHAGGHKVLIFSQMTTVLTFLEDYCDLRGNGRRLKQSSLMIWWVHRCLAASVSSCGFRLAEVAAL